MRPFCSILEFLKYLAPGTAALVVRTGHGCRYCCRTASIFVESQRKQFNPTPRPGQWQAGREKVVSRQPSGGEKETKNLKNIRRSAQMCNNIAPLHTAAVALTGCPKPMTYSGVCLLCISLCILNIKRRRFSGIACLSGYVGTHATT